MTRSSDHIDPDSACACGCGRMPIPGQRYIMGHWNRMTGPEFPEYHEEDRGHETPCWIWQRSRNASGAGFVSADGTTRSARRVVYERERGPVPAGSVLEAKCGVVACVNPEHAEPTSPSEAARRRRLQPHQPRTPRTVCKRGHPLTPDNTIVNAAGIRCRTCLRAYEREHYARKAAAQRAEPAEPPAIPLDDLSPLPRCPRGHVIAGENASPRGDGRFRCRVCMNAAALERYHRKKAGREHPST